MTSEQSLDERGESAGAARVGADAARATTDDPDRAIAILQELAELAKEVEAELQRAKRAAETEAAAPPAGCPCGLSSFARSSRTTSTS